MRVSLDTIIHRRRNIADFRGWCRNASDEQIIRALRIVRQEGLDKWAAHATRLLIERGVLEPESR